ncbi:MAG: hypothetical protein ACREX0_05825 [Noviherbaspirillum sp.]
MKRHSKRASERSAGRSTTSSSTPPDVKPAPTPYAGKPLDGSQYIEVIEEQEYSEQRPTAEEQRPRYSFLRAHNQQREE